MRVSQYLTDNQVVFETIAHPPAFTAHKRAKFLHVPGRHVAKAVLMAGPEDYFLAVLPATHHIDPEALASAIGGPVRLADCREMARVFPDCEWGVAPPFASLYGLSAVVDAALDPEDLLIFEGHTHGEALRIRCRDYLRLEQPARLPFARRDDGPTPGGSKAQ